MDVLHRAGKALCLNIIVDTEGARDENQHTACEVGKRTVDRKTNANAERGDQRGDATGIDPDIADEPDSDKDLRSDFENIKRRAQNGFIRASFPGGFLNFFGNKIDDLKGNDEKDQGNE